MFYAINILSLSYSCNDVWRDRHSHAHYRFKLRNINFNIKINLNLLSKRQQRKQYTLKHDDPNKCVYFHTCIDAGMFIIEGRQLKNHVLTSVVPIITLGLNKINLKNHKQMRQTYII